MLNFALTLNLSTQALEALVMALADSIQALLTDDKAKRAALAAAVAAQRAAEEAAAAATAALAPVTAERDALQKIIDDAKAVTDVSDALLAGDTPPVPAPDDAARPLVPGL